MEAPADTPIPPGSLPHDNTALLEVYKKATIRCGLRWPVEAAAEAVEVPLWQGIEEEHVMPPRKSKIPLAKGFKETFSSFWKAPCRTAERRPAFSLDCEDMVATGLAGLLRIDRTMAAYLL